MNRTATTIPVGRRRIRDIRTFKALRHPEFRRIWFVVLAVQTAFWLNHINAQGLMVALTDNDPAWVTALFVALFGPVLVLSPFTGVLADRVERRKILMVGYALLGAITATIGTLQVTGSLGPWSLVLLSALLGSGFTLNAPALQATVANSVPAYDLGAAIALQSMTLNFTRIVGPIAVVPIIDREWFAAPYFAYTIACVVAFFVVRGLRITNAHLETSTAGVAERLRIGVRHARDRWPAMPSLILTSAFSLFVVGYLALIPSFTELELDRDGGAFGRLIAATGLGGVIGAMLVGSFEATFRRAAVMGILFAAMLAVLSQVSSYEVALVVLVLQGIFYMGTFVTAQTVIQQRVDDDKRGRVMSLFHVSWAGFVPLGAIVMGLFTEQLGLGLRGAFLLGAAIAASIAAALIVVDASHRAGRGVESAG